MIRLSNDNDFVDTTGCYDSIMDDVISEADSYIDGPYYIHGDNDDIFTAFELGKKLAEEGVDYNLLTISGLFTKEMDRGFTSGWESKMAKENNRPVKGV